LRGSLVAFEVLADSFVEEVQRADLLGRGRPARRGVDRCLDVS
jgi:hypothetical protein